MTTDNFTEAARAEAERRHFPLFGRPPVIAAVAMQGFQDGAEWARDHLGAQEPTDGEVMVAMTAYEGHPDRVSAWRAALSAAWSARAARRDEEKR